MYMESTTSTIHIIPLGSEYLHAPYISHTLVERLKQDKKDGKQSLLFYNRRGHSRAYICEDCGYYEKCPHCDIALAHHSLGWWKLMCHQCGFKNPIPLICPYCGWSHFHLVWVGIQRIESDLRNILPESTLLRIDSDNNEKVHSLKEQIKECDIILATNRAFFVPTENIGSIVFLLFEVNFSIPDYTVEESIAAEISYFKKHHKTIILQTYMPDHPLIEEIMTGNNRTMLQYLSKERKEFHYPPFSSFVGLSLHHEKKDKVLQYAAYILEKIAILGQGTLTLSYDHDAWMKNRSEWVQKIGLRWPQVDHVLMQIEKDIVLSRLVTVERT